MNSITEQQFVEWATSKGLRLEPGYPETAVLNFHGELDEARFWHTPPEPQRRPYFIRCLLSLLGDWHTCHVWRHMGSWPSQADAGRINDPVEYEIFKGLGLPLGTADVVQFVRPELDKLVTLMFTTTIFGWSQGEDLYVVPDHARAIIQTDHHNVIHVVCKEPSDMPMWINGMEEEGFPLPTELPDSTFKLPSWMKRNDG